MTETGINYRLPSLAKQQKEISERKDRGKFLNHGLTYLPTIDEKNTKKMLSEITAKWVGVFSHDLDVFHTFPNRPFFNWSLKLLFIMRGRRRTEVRD